MHELKLRSAAGQHELVLAALKLFPTEGVGGEVLQSVREMTQDYQIRAARRQEVVKQLRELAERLRDTISKENLKPILDEIAAEIGENTLDRLAAFLQTASNPKTPDTEKLALAVSGWLLGADAATDELPVAISAYKVRRLIREYLNGVSSPDRERIYSYIKQEAGGEMSMVANLLAHMKPPIRPPKPVHGKPGYFEVEVPGLAKEEPFTYCIQLPPEYDPYRLYPTIVTLHGEVATPSQQIDWWAGDWNKAGQRTGQAARYGYIVIAPQWSEEHQNSYGYSAREHAAVLNSLRDACRRFADRHRSRFSFRPVDGRRRGLGHRPVASRSVGGRDPDRGAIRPLLHVLLAERPLRAVLRRRRRTRRREDGQKRPQHARPLAALRLQRHGRRVSRPRARRLLRRHSADVRLDEPLPSQLLSSRVRLRIHAIVGQLLLVGGSAGAAGAIAWSIRPTGPRPPAQPVQIKAKMTDKNGLNVRTGTSQVTVWLSPKMLNFKDRATITLNGRRIGGDQMIHPDLGTLLEDVRTRGDRQHPFWAKIESTTGRARGQ